MPCNFDIYFWDILHLSEPSMGEIGKQRQSNEMEWYGAVQDLSFYKTKWILKFSFKHCIMKEIKIF
jgi:hypothetical protein